MKEILEQFKEGKVELDEVLTKFEEAKEDASKDMIPRSRLNAKNEEIKELKDQLKERDTQLDDLSKKAKGNEELEQELQRYKDENKQTVEEYEAKLQEQTFNYELEKALSGAKAKNPKAVKALLNTEAIKLDGDKLLGLEEQLNSLKEQESYLFGEDEPKGLKGREPHPSDPNKQQAGITKDQFNQMGYTERVKLYQEQPDVYKQLTEKGE